METKCGQVNMNELGIKLSYSRPVALSDPYQDFDPSELTQIINTPDTEVAWNELSCIFQAYLPAGAYEECAYFVPHALNFIEGDTDTAGDLATHFIWWIAENKSNLVNDGVYNSLLLFFQKLLAKKISLFELKENKDGYLYPENCAWIEFIISSFNEYPVFNSLGDEWLIELLGKVTTFAQAAWTLHFIRDYYQHDQYARMNSRIIEKWSKDRDKLNKIQNLIIEEVFDKTDMITQYWSRMLNEAGI